MWGNNWFGDNKLKDKIRRLGLGVDCISHNVYLSSHIRFRATTLRVLWSLVTLFTPPPKAPLFYFSPLTTGGRATKDEKGSLWVCKLLSTMGA